MDADLTYRLAQYIARPDASEDRLKRRASRAELLAKYPELAGALPEPLFLDMPDDEWATLVEECRAYVREHRPIEERGEYRCDGCSAVEPYGGDAETNGCHGDCPGNGRWRAHDAP